MQGANHHEELARTATKCLNHEWWTPKQKLANPNVAADMAGTQTPQPYFHATVVPLQSYNSLNNIDKLMGSWLGKAEETIFYSCMVKVQKITSWSLSSHTKSSHHILEVGDARLVWDSLQIWGTGSTVKTTSILQKAWTSNEHWQSVKLFHPE